MILYAASPLGQSLADFVAGGAAALLARARALGARYVRFGPSPTPDVALARLLANFNERFGALPPANADPHESQ